MIYEKQNFKDGQVLTAEQLNKMEEYFQHCPQCYVEYGEEQVFFPEAQFTYTDEWVYVPDAISGVYSSSKYTVNYNGTDYECVGKSFDMDGVSTIALGDLSYLGQEDGSGEPFAVLVIPEELVVEIGVGAIIVLPAEMANKEFTISISGRSEIIHQLDEKFLPASKVRLMHTEGRVICDWAASDLYNALLLGKFLDIQYTGGCGVLKLIQITHESSSVREGFHLYFMDVSSKGNPVYYDIVCTAESFSLIE
jgi:hypothetical protein